MDVEHCLVCEGEITDTRFALARKQTGDLVFCGGQCWRRWEKDKVNRLERLEMEERFVQLGADAVCRRHPNGAWLVEKGRTRPIPLTDRALEAACERLAAWIAEHDAATERA